MDANELDTDGLSGDAIDAKPIDIDWSEALGPDYEGWMSWEAYRCDKCKRAVMLPRGGESKHCDAANAAGFDGCDCDEIAEGDQGHAADCPLECEGYLAEPEGPMMNYWYPCAWRGEPTDYAEALADLPVCLVEVNGKRGLALTGGGMDLSWEICAAYVEVGFLPPVHFVSDLPKMAERFDDEKRLVLKAGRASLAVAARRIKAAVERLDDVELWYMEYDAERARKEGR